MSEIQSNPERELLLLVSRGDEQAFERMIYLYSERVFFHALTFIKSWHQAEELVQDIFMRKTITLLVEIDVMHIGFCDTLSAKRAAFWSALL